MAPASPRGKDRGMTIPIRSQEHTVPFLDAKVEDVMTQGLISCPAQTPLRVVASRMAPNSVPSLVLTYHTQEDDEASGVWGLVSALDLGAAAWGDLERTAGESAVTPLVYVDRDDALRHAAQLMAENGISHLA